MMRAVNRMAGAVVTLVFAMTACGSSSPSPAANVSVTSSVDTPGFNVGSVPITENPPPTAVSDQPVPASFAGDLIFCGGTTGTIISMFQRGDLTVDAAGSAFVGRPPVLEPRSPQLIAITTSLQAAFANHDSEAFSAASIQLQTLCGDALGFDPIAAPAATAAPSAPAPVAAGYSFTSSFDAKDNAGYTFSVTVTVTIGPANVTIANAPPGLADVENHFQFAGTVTNTTPGRNTQIGGSLVPTAALWIKPPPDGTDLGPDGLSCGDSRLDPAKPSCELPHSLAQVPTAIATPAGVAVPFASSNTGVMSFRTTEDLAGTIAAGLNSGDNVAFVGISFADSFRIIFDGQGNIVKECDGADRSGNFTAGGCHA